MPHPEAAWVSEPELLSLSEPLPGAGRQFWKVQEKKSLLQRAAPGALAVLRESGPALRAGPPRPQQASEVRRGAWRAALPLWRDCLWRDSFCKWLSTSDLVMNLEMESRGWRGALPVGLGVGPPRARLGGSPAATGCRRFCTSQRCGSVLTAGSLHSHTDFSITLNREDEF